MILKKMSKALGLMMATAMFCGAAGAQAQENKLYFDDFTIDGDEVVNVPVILDNTFNAGAMQCTVELPSVLEFAGDGQPIPNTDRLVDGIQIGQKNDVVLITNWTLLMGNETPIAGNSGTLFYLPIKQVKGQSEEGEFQISLTNIRLTTVDGQEGINLEPYTGTVKVIPSAVEPEVINCYASADAISIAPGQTYDLAFSFSNNFEVQGFQVNANLPEGLSIEGNPVKGDRMTKSSTVMMTNRGNGVYNFLGVDVMGGIPVTGEDGPLFTITVKADENLAESCEIVFDNFIASNVKNEEVFGNNCYVKVVNDSQNVENLYKQAQEALANTQAMIGEAMEEIKTNCPLVAGDYNGNELMDKLSSIVVSVETWHADGTLAANYEVFEAELNGLNDWIPSYVKEAYAAQEKALASLNYARYQDVLSEIAYLQASFDEAVANLKPGHTLEGEISYAQNLIYEARNAAEEAYAALAPGETFEFSYDYYEIWRLIDIITEQGNYDKNLDAYNAEMEKLGAVEQKLQQAEADAKVKDVDVTKQVEAVLNAIAAERDAATKALETETTFSYEVDTDHILALIDAIYDEVARVVANREAYQETLATVDMLQDELNDLIEYVMAKDPDSKLTVELDEAQGILDTIRTDAAKALEAVKEVGIYNYTVDVDSFRALLKSIKEQAGTTGVTAIDIENLGKDVKIYNLNGVEIRSAKTGSVVIIRNVANGTTSKVVVK